MSSITLLDSALLGVNEEWWARFYKDHFDISWCSLDTPHFVSAAESDVYVVVPCMLGVDMFMQFLRGVFPVRIDDINRLDYVASRNIRTPDRGSYSIWISSLQSLAPPCPIGERGRRTASCGHVTLLEGLLFEYLYFCVMGQPSGFAGYCLGSTTSDGFLVPLLRWVDGVLVVAWGGASSLSFTRTVLV